MNSKNFVMKLNVLKHYTMEEKLVPFEIAKLLRLKGFADIIGTFRGKHYYNHKGELDGDVLDAIKHRNDTDKEKYESIPAPTLSLAQKWLREVHNCHIHIVPEPHSSGINYNWQVLIYNPNDETCWDKKSTGLYGDNGEYPTYEDALEAGIEMSLKLIK